MSVSRQALLQLLKNAERASASNRKPRDVVFSPASMPAYNERMTAARLDEIHTELVAAQRVGAIEIVWERRAGDRGQVKRVALRNADALAVHLGMTPLWHAVASAEQALAPWRSRSRVVNLLADWKVGKAPRGRRPSDVKAFVDALKILDRLAESPPDLDRSLRRFSATLFADSKRIDDLWVELDLLTKEDEGPPRTDAEVFSGLGLVVHQQPFLMAGRGVSVRTTAGEIAVPEPYVGLPPQIIDAVNGEIEYVLSVENLDTFHELALGAAGPVAGLLLYTGGMPSPAWVATYLRVIDSVCTHIPALHWGDTDVGGVRILRKLDDVLLGVGRRIRPWMMGADAGIHHKILADSDAAFLAKLSLDRGWQEIARFFEISRHTFEQQTQAVALPQQAGGTSR